MPYLPDGVPLPRPGPDDQPYWDFCRNRDLRIQRCSDCGTFRHPPAPVCAHCGSFAKDWAPVSGRGTVFSYTVIHHAVHPALKQAVPYNIAIVLLDDAGDVRLVSNVIDAAPADMRIGMPVQLAWDATADGGFVPRFRKA